MPSSRWTLISALLMTACGGDTAVPNSSAGQWGEPATLIENLRIGEFESEEDAYMLGRITELVPDGNGGVYAFDDRVPAIRHFNSDGVYVRTIGAQGSGPGEYENVLLGMDRLPDDRLIVRDPRNRRFTLYNPDGTFSEQWPLDSGLYTSRAVYVDRQGQVFARIVTSRPLPDEPLEMGLLRLDGEGIPLDTLQAPSISGEEQKTSGYFSVNVEWDLHPEGYLVVGLNNEYAVELRKPGGTVVLSRDLEPVEVHSEERAEWEAIREWQIETQGQFMSRLPGPTPFTKPFYRSIYAGADGSIWIRRYVDAIRPEGDQPTSGSATPDGAPPPRSWREPVVFDVFQDDGTFLGEVHVPDGISLSTYTLDDIWGTLRGEQGETYLVRMTLSVPNQSL